MRLIDVDAYIKYCDDNWIPLNVDAVNAQPTADAVPVVRCKDCKYYAEELCWNVFGRCVTVSDMDYCSSGEMRDDDETDENGQE